MDKENKRTAILLINLGTPDEPTEKAVGRYLTQFLNDKYVISIPWLFRKILVNLIIIPFRVKYSAKLYQQLWTSEGSPLAVYMKQLRQKLQEKVKENAVMVFAAMRYQNPSIQSALEDIRTQGFEKIIILPLYPQFASSTTTSTIEEVKRVLKTWKGLPEIHTIDSFYTHPGFLNAYVNRINTYQPGTYDFVLFSFHGLPNSHIAKVHSEADIPVCDCEADLSEHGRFCYKAACYHTAELLAERLNLPTNGYSVSFQSRLSKNWLTPFSDTTLTELAGKGYKRVLVVAPAFVADCLETIVEIGVEYKEMFVAKGGNELTLVESLNADDHWVNGIKEIVSDFIG